MRSAGEFIKEKLLSYLPANFPIDQLVGLVETSIGKMVPIMPLTELEKDPLMVFAEPYNNLIVDRKGFKGPIPEVEGLCPKENIKAWVDRKAFIHNLGHATVAYFGAFKHPESTYIYEVLDDKTVYNFAREVMLQSAAVLQTFYPKDFTFEELETHIDDLLYRFRNKALKDTIFRVGQDRPRKLGQDDRFVGIIRLAESLGMNYDKILEAMSYAFYFQATDENGNKSTQDMLFENYLTKGVEYTLQKISGFDPVKDEILISEFIQYYLLID
jgi:mannitol-1-phosphate 5-dehydrogenase